MVMVADDVVVAPTALVAGTGAHFVHAAAKMSVVVALQVFAKRWAAVVAMLTVPAFGAVKTDAEIAVLVVAVKVLDAAVTLSAAAAVSEIDVTPAAALAVASGVAMAVEAEIAVRVTAAEKE